MITELNKQIIDNEPEFFFVWDIGSQQIIRITNVGRDYTPFTLKERSDNKRMVEDFIHPQDLDKFRTILRNFSSENALQDHDFRVNHEKYNARYLNLRSFLIKDKQESCAQVVAHISNVTKRYEQLEALQKSSEWKKEIIHMLVHDLKNPFSSIRMLSCLAQQRIQEGSISVASHFLKLIDTVEEDATHLIETLLRLLELSDTKFSSERKPTNFSALVQSSVEHFSAKASEYAISLTTDLPRQAVWILADSRILMQVLDNLLSNALKFTPAKGYVEVRLSNQPDRITLSVRDTGIGIPDDQQAKLFEKFTKARRVGIHGEKTSGLGLSIVKKIIDMHGGKIHVTSQEHQGSTFFVELPTV